MNQSQPEIEKVKEQVRELKCVNGAMYFGAVEDDSCNCKTRCQNEQTYEHALEELDAFIEGLWTKAYEQGKVDGAKVEKGMICEIIEDCGHQQEDGSIWCDMDDVLKKIKKRELTD